MYKAQTTERKASEGQQAPFSMFAFLPLAPDAEHARAVERLFVDWSDFVHRRIDADVRLWQRVAASRAPSDLWGAYFSFWQVAAQDYWKEYAALTRSGGVMLRPSTEADRDPAPEPAQSQALHQAA